MKRLILCFLALALLLCFSGCAKYREKDMLGKTVSQIQETYGTFDLMGVSFVTTDSTYRGIGSGYLVKESTVGFLGTSPAEYFFIVFDESGIAIDCYNGYHCNGG